MLVRIRVALDCSLPAERVLLALRGEPFAFALTGRWAGGGAIVGCAPLAHARRRGGPVRRRSRTCPRRAVTPRSAAAGSAGSATAWARASRRSRRAHRARIRSPTPTWRSTTMSCGGTARGGGGSSRWTRRSLDAALEHAARAARRRARAARRPRPRPSRCARPVRPGTWPRSRTASSGSPPARSSRPTSACGSTRPTPATSPSSTRTPRPSCEPAYGACFLTPWGGVAQPLARALPAPPRPARDHRADQGHRARRPGQRCATSPKDRAEHVMIVDLMRNDLGRVAAYGSVHAPEAPEAQPHAGVWHLVSEVERGARPRPRRRGAAARDLPARLGHRRAQGPGAARHLAARGHRTRGLHRRDRLRQPARRPRAQRRHPHLRGPRRPPVARRRRRNRRRL